MEQDNHGEKKSRLEIFKYNAILSILFFIGSTFYLGSQVPNFNLSIFTISQMSYFLNPKQLSIFNFLFFIKCFMDLSFTFYVFKYLKIPLLSITAISWLIAVLSFGILGFFPTHSHFQIHLIIVYIMFIFWSASEYLFAKLTKDKDFKYLTNNLLLVQAISIVLFVATNNFNGVFEIVYMLFIFLWLMIFIGKFLK